MKFTMQPEFAARTIGIIVVIVICGSLMFQPAARADDTVPAFRETNLSGDWAGARTRLFNQGVTLDVVYTADVMGVARGGLRRGMTALDNLDLVVTLDNEKLLDIPGNSVKLYYLNNNGGEPNETYAGTLQGVNNIEVTTQTALLLEAWVQQNLWQDRVSLLAGLYDLNSEFYVNDSAALFLGSTFGLGHEFASAGLSGPSTFPITSLAFRARIEPIEQTYLMAAILDGVPGDPGDPRGTQISLAHGDGALLVAELGVTPASLGRAFGGKYAIGAWRFTDRLDDVRDIDANGDPVRRRSEGIYLMAEAPLFREKAAGDEGLVGFVRAGISDGDTNAFESSWSAGLVYSGLFPGRESGVLGFGIGQARHSAKFRDALAVAGSAVDVTETGFELTYRDDIHRGVAVQPNLQYFVNPAADPALRDALVLGLRLIISL